MKLKGKTARIAGASRNTGPLRRTGRMDEVANVALFLAAEESSFVTGERITCAGGRYT